MIFVSGHIIFWDRKSCSYWDFCATLCKNWDDIGSDVLAEPMWETALILPNSLCSYLIFISAACRKVTVRYLRAAVFYHNSGIRLSLWKTFWNVLWYPLVWNVPQKCKSCHWLSRSTWPSRSVLLHYWAAGRGGQQGKAKEKQDFSFHLEDSYWQNGIQCTPGLENLKARAIVLLSQWTWRRMYCCPCSYDTAQAVLCELVGRLFSLWIMVLTSTEVFHSLDLQALSRSFRIWAGKASLHW